MVTRNEECFLILHLFIDFQGFSKDPVCQQKLLTPRIFIQFWYHPQQKVIEFSDGIDFLGKIADYFGRLN